MNKQQAIKHYDEHIKVLEELIEDYGINRSLGNVLQNVKSRLDWWNSHQ